MRRTWFIAGAAGGLGRHLVRTALAAGHSVFAADLDAEGLSELAASASEDVHKERLVTARLNLTARADIADAVQHASQTFDGLDVVVNSAGYRAVGSLEDMTEEEFDRTLDTNLYGALHLVRAVLPILRPRRSGRIVQISTIGGRRAQPGLAAYQTAAWGIGGLFEILARELAPFGVHATVLETGGIRTARADRPLPTGGWQPEYDETVGHFARTYQRNPNVQRGDPAKIADAVLRLTNEPDPPARLLLGSDTVWLAPRIASARATEDEAWRHLSLSTDRDDLPDFATTDVADLVRPTGPTHGAHDTPEQPQC